jgi:hypothetical protein
MSGFDQPYTKKERRIIDTILEPSGKTIEQIALQITEYTVIHAQAAEILITNRARHAELVKDLEENPKMSHVVFIDGEKKNLGQNNLGIWQYQDRPGELWELLSQYDKFLQIEPTDYDQ